jgi:hypothetical protein
MYVFRYSTVCWYSYRHLLPKFRIGPLQHRSLKAYCALTPKEFLYSSLEALHTERFTAPQLAKEGTMWREFSYLSSNLHR